MEKELGEISKWMAYGEFAEIFHIADAATSIYYDNSLGCGYDDILVSIKNHCETNLNDNGESVCSFGQVFTNMFTKRVIETMGAGTTLANAVKEFKLQVDKDLIREQT